MLAALLSVLALVQAVHKARKGQCALLKWRPHIEALERGEIIYGREGGGTREGFPTPPTTAIALSPFLELADVPAAVAWAVLKLALAWWMLATVARMVAGSVKAFPPWALVVVIALTARVLLSDIAHGNVNIPVAAIVVAAGWQWQRGNERSAGLLAGLGAALKVTPALFLVYFLWKRGFRASFHFVVGVALAGLALPMLVLGPRHHLDLVAAWWQQMVAPYASGAELTVVQTEQINQSMLGVLARLLTDSIAIRARPPIFPGDVSINFVSLSQGELRLCLAACTILVLAVVACCSRTPRERRSTPSTAGEIALVALAMLFLSERSWKQHYVTLCLPIAFLAWLAATRGGSDRVGRSSVIALAVSTLLHGLSGSGALGDVASDYAEAYGAWFFGGVALFAACGFALRRFFFQKGSWARDSGPS